MGLANELMVDNATNAATANLLPTAKPRLGFADTASPSPWRIRRLAT